MSNDPNPHTDNVGEVAEWLQYELKHTHGLTEEDLQKMADRQRAVAKHQLEMYKEIQARADQQTTADRQEPRNSSL